MMHIRPATIHHPAPLRTMIPELAEYEQELQRVTIREQDLARDGLGENPRFRALVADWDGLPAGYAVFFAYFSIWVGRGLFLEDRFVREAFRGRGMGRGWLAEVARIAVDEKGYGIHWEVLNWNERAIAMYRGRGAEFRDRWRPVRRVGEALQKLAETTP